MRPAPNLVRALAALLAFSAISLSPASVHAAFRFDFGKDRDGNDRTKGECLCGPCYEYSMDGGGRGRVFVDSDGTRCSDCMCDVAPHEVAWPRRIRVAAEEPVAAPVADPPLAGLGVSNHFAQNAFGLMLLGAKCIWVTVLMLLLSLAGVGPTGEFFPL
jgi:hypothetical protein